MIDEPVEKASESLTKPNCGAPQDDTLRELPNRCCDTITRKLVLMSAWCDLLSRFLNGRRAALETTHKIGAGASPLGSAQARPDWPRPRRRNPIPE